MQQRTGNDVKEAAVMQRASQASQRRNEPGKDRQAEVCDCKVNVGVKEGDRAIEKIKIGRATG